MISTTWVLTFLIPTRNVNLTEDLDRSVLMSVESGRYEDESEVVRAALTSLEREARLASLRGAIDEGDASGLAQPGAFDRVRRHLQLSETKR